MNLSPRSAILAMVPGPVPPGQLGTTIREGPAAVDLDSMMASRMYQQVWDWGCNQIRDYNMAGSLLLSWLPWET